MIFADRSMLLVDIATRFGKNLSRARKKAGLSQEEAGIRASLHRTEIGLLERGERVPRIDTAIKLAGAVGVSLGELTDGIEWSPGTANPGNFSVKDKSRRN
ncbi:MAG TPA: helix-turn-helix transcriptional regulator [Solirubrobacterales bacterium]|nr:helix-turn-helix transcriptional regulator [Solirubrobacterales bacterium]